jgi:hypothetical protein
LKFGSLSFVPIESFVNKAYKLSRDEQISQVYDVLEERPLSEASNWSWMDVTTAIKRGEEFAMEASTPSHWAYLRFSLRNPEIGKYEITGTSPKFNESGVTQKITPIRSQEADPRFGKIITCATRYVVLTITLQHPIVRRAWILGLDSFREFEEEI